MMDEQLIAEVEQHGVIYNRQKYSINSMGGPGAGGGGGGCSAGGVNKYETKEEAWQIIAIKLQTDVEACKKRWKYLRERYVSQRKQGDPPVYDHLSRPYLEKMKFLDQHIQPRKSYRNVSSYLTSPNTSSSFVEYNMDSSKSNGSLKNMSFPVHQSHSQPPSSVYQPEGAIKTETDQSFHDFVTSQQLKHFSAQYNTSSIGPNSNSNHSNTALPPSVDSYDQYRDSDHHTQNINGGPINGNGMTSSTSSSMKSPLSSSPPPPPPAAPNNAPSELSDDHQFTPNGTNNMKKPRVQMSNQYLDTSDSEENISPAPAMHHSSMMNDNHSSSHIHQSHQQSHLPHQQQHQQQQQQYNKMLSNVARNMTNMNHTPSGSGNLFPSNNDFLFSLYQQMAPGVAPPQHDRNMPAAAVSPIRSSEHLLGELVTSELLKMNKERRKTVQKRILEILFFED